MKRIITSLSLLALLGTAGAQIQRGSDINGEAVDDGGSSSLCMPDANTIAVGAGNNNGNGSDAGHVRVFAWNGAAWVQKGSDIDGDSADNLAGRAVTMPDANTIAIAAPTNGANGTAAGQVRVFSWNGSSWVRKGTDIYGEATQDRSGWDISMPDANTLAIGSINNDGSADNAGHVRVFTWNGSAWTQKGSDIDGEDAYDVSGGSVVMPDANTVAIGASGNGNNHGHVRVYSWDGAAWVQKGTDLDGAAQDDQFGWDISMPDANTLAVGSPFHDENVQDDGLVRVYTWNGTAWVQKGLDVYGQTNFDAFGYSVSMPDANTLAVGAPLRDVNGTNSGKVYIFEWSGMFWLPKGAGINGQRSNGGTGFSVFMPDAQNLAVASARDAQLNPSGSVAIYSLCGTNSTIAPSVCDVYISPSGKYTWTVGGNYSDTIPNAAGCDSVITIQLTVKKADVTIGVHQDSLLKADATNATFQWIDCDDNFAAINNETNQTFLPPDEGNYAVIVTQNGCTDTSDCISVIKNGIPEGSLSGISAYPNPTQGKVVIDLGPEQKGVTLVVRDILGRELLTRSYAQTHRIELDLPGETGCYFIELLSDDGQKVRLKVMKE